jgi:hypothetical protein
MAKRYSGKDARKLIAAIIEDTRKVAISRASGKIKIPGITFRDIGTMHLAQLNASAITALSQAFSSEQDEAAEFIEWVQTSGHSTAQSLRGEGRYKSLVTDSTLASKIAKAEQAFSAEKGIEYTKGEGKFVGAHLGDSSASMVGMVRAAQEIGTGTFKENTNKSGGLVMPKGTGVFLKGKGKSRKAQIRGINRSFWDRKAEEIGELVAKDFAEGLWEIESNVTIDVKDFVEKNIKRASAGGVTQNITIGTRTYNSKLRVLESSILRKYDKLFEEYTLLMLENLAKELTGDENNWASLKLSPSAEDRIADGIVEAIVGKKGATKGKSKSTKTPVKKAEKPSTKIIAATIAYKRKKRSPQKKQGQIQAQMSPLALRGLLQRAISAAIKHNMGKGRARTVLNYRTGRFAESVNIDNVVPRRDGAMIAFYSYMKNPYSTFAEGGAQYPSKPSRDPNLLIKKSMRQLAAAAAVTRFFPMES